MTTKSLYLTLVLDWMRTNMFDNAVLTLSSDTAIWPSGSYIVTRILSDQEKPLIELLSPDGKIKCLGLHGLQFGPPVKLVLQAFPTIPTDGRLIAFSLD
jgi:hypothetical protein